MTESDPIISAAVFDFLQDLEDDVLQDKARPLSTYLARYPEAESQVAAEYLRRTQAAPPLRTGVNLGRGTKSEGRKGRYRVIEPLGQGGQGTVYLAEDVRLGRRVALKQLDGRWITQTRRLRFQREAEIVARIDHPAIAEVLDADFDASEPFIVMRYVRGADLASELRRAKENEGGLIPVRPKTLGELHRVLRYFESVANALDVAHEAGVVHRDVKPGNLMVAPNGQAAVLDFGLAMESKSDALTREGEGMGTPEYMAPEQISEAVGDIDRRTDIHALGLVLFEVLTGERPFRGSTMHEIHAAILDAERPSLRQIDRTFPRDLSIVVATAFDRDPSRRYATAASFAGDLRRVRVVEPILARPAGAWLKIRRWAQREPALSAALLVLIVSLGLGLVQSNLGIRERDKLIADNQSLLRLKDNALGEKEAALRHEKQALNIWRSQLFTERSEARVGANPSAALALAYHAAELNSSKGTRSALYAPLSRSRLQKRFRDATGRHFSNPSLSQNGDWVLAIVGGRTASIMAVEGDGREIVELPIDDATIVSASWVNAPSDFVVATAEGQALRWSAGAVAWQSNVAGTPRTVRVMGEELELTNEAGDSVCLGLDDGVQRPNLSSRLPHPPGEPLPLAAHIDERGETPQVVVSSTESSREVLRIDVPEGQFVGPCISPDGRLVAYALSPGRVLAWSISSGELLLDETADFVPQALHWVSDSRRLLLTTRTGNVYLWRAEPIPELVRLRETGPLVKLCAFLRGGAAALVVGSDGHSAVYNVRTSAQHSGGKDTGLVGSVQWEDRTSPEATHAASAATADRWVVARRSGEVELWGWLGEEGMPRAIQSTTASSPVVELQLNGEGNQVLWRTEEGGVFLWLPMEGPGSERSLRGVASSMCLVPEGSGAYLGRENGEVQRPDGSTLRAPFPAGEDHSVVALSVSPDGTKLAAGYFPHFVVLWDLSTGTQIGSGVLVSRLDKIQWSRSGELIALGAEVSGGTLRTIVVGAKKAVARSIPREAGVVALAPGRGGDEFLVACRSGDAFLFSDGKEPRVGFPLHAAPLTSIATSRGPGDARAISGDEAGSVYVWPLDPEDAARRRIARYVDEWERRLIDGTLVQPPGGVPAPR